MGEMRTKRVEVQKTLLKIAIKGDGDVSLKQTNAPNYLYHCHESGVTGIVIVWLT